MVQFKRKCHQTRIMPSPKFLARAENLLILFFIQRSFYPSSQGSNQPQVCRPHWQLLDAPLLHWQADRKLTINIYHEFQTVKCEAWVAAIWTSLTNFKQVFSSQESAFLHVRRQWALLCQVPVKSNVTIWRLSLLACNCPTSVNLTKMHCNNQPYHYY